MSSLPSTGLPDALGARFPDNQIRDSRGVQVAFSSERRGDDLLFVADVQNNWSNTRLVVFSVTVSSGSSARSGTFPRAEYSAQMAGGEVGRFEIAVRIPPDAQGRFTFVHSLTHSHTGKPGTRCRSVSRRVITNDRTAGDRVGLVIGLGLIGVALGFMRPAGAWIATYEVEPGPREFLAPRGSYTPLVKPEGPLPVVPLPRGRTNWRQLAVVTALVVGAIAIVVALDIVQGR